MRWKKRFSENISRLRITSDVARNYESTSIVNKIIVNLHEFRSFMEDEIGSDIDSRLIITMK